MKPTRSKAKTSIRNSRAHKRPLSESDSSFPEKFFKVRAALDLFQFLDYRDYLSKFYEALKTSRKSYSYAKFSVDIGLSDSNALWQVLAHRRDLSDGSAERICMTLKMSFEEKKHFRLLVKHNNARDHSIREECMQELVALKGRTLNNGPQERILEYYEEWYHPVIREMTALENFDANPDWINEKLFLKLTPRKIEKSLALLQELHLIKFDTVLNRYIQTGNQIMPDRKVQGLASIRYHQKACEIARESISSVSALRRDLNVLTLCLSDEAAQEIKIALHEACKKAMDIEKSTKNHDQVYQINVQLFALTK